MKELYHRQRRVSRTALDSVQSFERLWQQRFVKQREKPFKLIIDLKPIAVIAYHAYQLYE